MTVEESGCDVGKSGCDIGNVEESKYGIGEGIVRTWNYALRDSN